ncbi:4Fe-4S binding protein [Alkaliphilus peptidifermentans]|uniref:4Fe-4S binding domain-containing protein n=1 Tax=Alkaliphilus peptidifermentans DSM 18978 TaxID=1120976 RepID=A0A1G5HUG0_9FIRM|nr:4Fe-4S binding protein [Alkaliphilus peptidifermentans]SCY67354.1 4Fe-4S binding domain-containing protein [Alkaliphilus peptidifermentans DSM 18978]
MKKSIMSWSWVFIVLFFTLGIIDIRFGILGLICMLVPIYLALRGGGRVHCAKYCPRGAMLGKFLQKLSFNNSLPKFINNKIVKNLMLLWMVGMFSISLFISRGDFTKTAYAIFRMMAMSTTVGIFMGVVFKPRSWCQICPMGTATGLIEKSQKRKPAKAA